MSRRQRCRGQASGRRERHRGPPAARHGAAPRPAGAPPVRRASTNPGVFPARRLRKAAAGRALSRLARALFARHPQGVALTAGARPAATLAQPGRKEALYLTRSVPQRGQSAATPHQRRTDRSAAGCGAWRYLVDSSCASRRCQLLRSIRELARRREAGAARRRRLGTPPRLPPRRHRADRSADRRRACPRPPTWPARQRCGVRQSAAERPAGGESRARQRPRPRRPGERHRAPPIRSSAS